MSGATPIVAGGVFSQRVECLTGRDMVFLMIKQIIVGEKLADLFPFDTYLLYTQSQLSFANKRFLCRCCYLGAKLLLLLL